MTVFCGTVTTTTPTVATATSTTILAANDKRKWLRIVNNSAANIMISLSGANLTGIAPTSTNIGTVIAAAGFFEFPSYFCSSGAVTAYQTSGGSINTIVVMEGF